MAAASITRQRLTIRATKQQALNRSGAFLTSGRQPPVHPLIRLSRAIVKRSKPLVEWNCVISYATRDLSAVDVIDTSP